MPKATILIVEDEEIVVADLGNKLTKLGYEICASTANGEEAVTLAAELRPELVLMDIHLAGSMDGIEAADRIHQELDIPVIFLTAHSDNATFQRAKLSDPFGYILKPFERQNLATSIDIALYKHLTERKLRESQTALTLANEELRVSNQTLEARVAARTAALEQRTNQLRALAAELIQAEERERRRIGTMLHDHLQQVLVGARLHLEYIRSRHKSDLPLQQLLLKVEGLIAESISSTRLLTSELSPNVLYHLGVGAAMKWLGRWCEDKYGLTVTVEAEPEAEVEAEEIRIALFQSVRELLFNVAKHAQVQSAAIRLRRLEDGTIQLAVSDNGVGFDLTEVRSREGTTGGFGLFSLRERLELLGIDLKIESAPGCGSRFIIQVSPKGAASPASNAQPALKSEAARSSATGEGRKIRIVLADDHAVVLESLVRALHEEPDFEVLGQATDGQQALELVRDLRPDVVLMDVAMPTMDGIEATRLLTAEHPGVKVIGLSMFDCESHGQAMRQAGAVDFLNKNEPFAKVVEAVRQHTGNLGKGCA
jgi:DNA-binding NarL/FixJ family response regulator